MNIDASAIGFLIFIGGIFIVALAVLDRKPESNIGAVNQKLRAEAEQENLRPVVNNYNYYIADPAMMFHGMQPGNPVIKQLPGPVSEGNK